MTTAPAFQMQRRRIQLPKQYGERPLLILISSIYIGVRTMREQIQRQIQRTRLKNNKLAKLGDAIYEDDDVKLAQS